MALIAATSIGWASAADAKPKFGQIKHEGACLVAPTAAALATPSLEDDVVSFRTCQHPDLREHWFYTPGRRPGDDTSKKSARNIGNMAFPAYCLASVNARRTGTAMRLELCDGTKSQQWKRNPRTGDDWMQSPYDTCARKTGTALVVAACEGGENDRKFEFEMRNVVRNKDLATARTDFANLAWPTEHAFDIFTMCKESDDTGGRDRDCYMKNNFFDDESRPYDENLPPMSNAIDGLTRSSTTFRYGFFTGPGHTGNEPLTLGNLNTLDRCAMGHDANIWGDSHFHPPNANNDSNFIACLENSVPVSIDDRKALNRAHWYFGNLDVVSLPVTGACAYQSRGHMPGFGEPIERCVCQLMEIAGTRTTAQGRCVLSGDPFDTQNELCVVAEGDFLSLREHAIEVYEDNCQPSINLVRDWQDAQIAREEAERIAALAQPRPHEIARGDWNWRLAERDQAPDPNVYIADFEALNPGVDANLVFIGRTYTLPPVNSARIE